VANGDTTGGTTFNARRGFNAPPEIAEQVTPATAEAD